MESRGEMRIEEIVDILDGQLIIGTADIDIDIDIMSSCGADLMSDVMACDRDKKILLTGLVNLQVVRTAEMMDIRVIIFVRGKVPDSAIMSLAEEKGITIISTNLPMFFACGKLYSKCNSKRGALNE